MIADRNNGKCAHLFHGIRDSNSIRIQKFVMVNKTTINKQRYIYSKSDCSLMGGPDSSKSKLTFPTFFLKFRRKKTINGKF